MTGEQPLRVQAGDAVLDADLTVPENAAGLVVFAHGSGSSRHSPRNRAVAAYFNDAGLGTLLVDLLTREEEDIDAPTARLRFDIPLISSRLVGITDTLDAEAWIGDAPLGYFGASTGGAAALVAAALRPSRVSAVVVRGGRPDLAGEALVRVRAPSLLLVGERDEEVLALNVAAAGQIRAEKELVVVRGATHLFTEPGTLVEVAERAATWFRSHFRAVGSRKTATG